MFPRLLIQSLLTFLALDAVWIGLVASPWTKRAIPHLLTNQPNYWAAGVFYLVYLTTLIVLIISPHLKDSSPTTLAWQSFLFGSTAYMTYDFTNLALMKGFPWTMALADTFWGGILTMLTALIIWRLNH